MRPVLINVIFNLVLLDELVVDVGPRLHCELVVRTRVALPLHQVLAIEQIAFMPNNAFNDELIFPFAAALMDE